MPSRSKRRTAPFFASTATRRYWASESSSSSSQGPSRTRTTSSRPGRLAGSFSSILRTRSERAWGISGLSCLGGVGIWKIC